MKDNLPLFSFFSKPITNTKPSKKVNIVDVYKMIKAIGNGYAAKTSALRGIQEKREAREFKSKQFDYVTFSGTFGNRSEKGLIKHSGLLVLDFDDVSNLGELRTLLLNDPSIETELLFVSPSGNGLKWVIEIDLDTLSHKEYFKAVANYLLHTYKIKVDESGKDIPRPCFLCHDSNVFLNPKYGINNEKTNI